MELLLILSALLSAATGAFTGTRAPEAGQRHEAAAVAVAQAAAAVVAPAATAAPDRPSTVRPARAAPAPADAPAMAPPLATERLIE